jgi:hypothetical protein
LNIFKRKPVKQATRLVWRMSATNPAGEFVCPSDRNAKSADIAEAHERGFRASSMDLTTGSAVSETEMNTLPGELVDAFLKPRR